MGLKIKLDTNGTNPEMLHHLISGRQIDYIAMDVKAPLSLSKYKEIAGKSFNTSLLDKVIKSIDIITNSGKVDFEFRTTLLENYHTENSIKEIAASLSGKLFVQNFQHSAGITRKDLAPFPGFDKLERSVYKSTLIDIRR